MNVNTVPRPEGASAVETLDALIIGAGVAGLYQLHLLREQGLNVRQAESLAHSEGVPTRKPQKARAGKVAKDPDTLALEKRVSDTLGLKVTIEHREPGGMVQIRYGNLDQLDDVMRRLVSGQ